MSISTRPSPPRASAAIDQEGVDVFPASSAQQRFWMLDQLDASAAAYTIPIALRLLGDLDVGALEAALNVIVARHESLRTVFALEGEEPVQVVLPKLALRIDLVDLAALSIDDRESRVRAASIAAANAPFDLARGPLVRASLLQLGARDQVLLLTLHHIVADGWSVGVLFRELESAYGALVRGEDPVLPPLPLQYPDFAVWQRKVLATEATARQLAYWKERLAGPLPVLDLPTDRPRPAVLTTNGAKREILLDAELVAGIRALARREGVTSYVAFLAAFYVLLQRYSGQDDLIVGSITAGRQRDELASLIGLFVNTLSLRVDLSGDPAFIELLRRVRDVTTSAMSHQDIPFEDVAEAIGAGHDRSRTPVFQAAFQLLESLAVELALPGLAASRVAGMKDTTKFELTLMLNAAPDGCLRAVMEYNTDLFDAATIDRMLGQYRTLLASIIRQPATSISHLTVISADERRTVVDEWNRTTAPYPADRCVHDCVTEQAGRTPDAVAIELDDRRMTFAELDRRSNQVAFRLRAMGIKPGAGVGVAVERSPELIVALLGVLKAGGHYVPLATDYPQERLAFMRDDARLGVLLMSPGQAWPSGDAQVMLVDEGLSAFADCPDGPVHSEATPESAAYVIYTSGSTGRPKGVVVPHRAVVNYIHWMRTTFPHDTGDAIVLKAPVSFDASVWELYLPLFTGARMVQARPGGASDPAYLIDLIQRRHVTTVQFVPSQLQVLTEIGGLERCTGLRRLFCGGEALPGALLSRIASLLPGAELTNLYGPTETTVYSTCWTLDRSRFDGSAPIGRPIANTRVYVLDAHRTPAPIGVPGELYIAGAGVSHGYLGRNELTAGRFVPDPFTGTPGATMYRTGDRVRWRTDGVLEYLGRIDHQVKLRGHRIELGEVESVLARHPAVTAATAIVREDTPGDRSLVAYVVLSGSDAVTPAMLRDHVRQSLPDIMVPSAVVVLERLPLNANAKLDRSQLPVPDATALATNAAAFVAPRTPLETDIAAIWAAVLHVDRVGVNDDFFDLGGHSLAAMRILARLTARLPESVTLGTIIKARTVATLAALVEAAPDASTDRRITPRTSGGPAPLSHSQRMIWLFEQMTPGQATYNVPMVRRIRGPIDLDRLRAALDAVVVRHEVLRTTFEEVEGEPRQVAHEGGRAGFAIVDRRGTPDAEQNALEVLQQAAVKPFDFGRCPLMRAVAVRIDDEDTLLLIVTHHIVFDGGSVGVLMRDLSAMYDALGRGTPADLPALPIQFADYAVWERDPLRDERIEASLDYWRTTLDGAPGMIDLPTDRSRTAAPSGPGARYVATFPAELRDSLITLAHDNDATLYMVLLAAFQSLLHRYSGQDDIVTGSPIAGRAHPETQDLIGYFANTLALRARFDGDPTFIELLGQVRDSALGAYEHQDVPYEQVVLDLRARRSAAHAALFAVMFVLQDGESAPLRLGDATVEGVAVDLGAAKFDLSCSMAEMAAGLRMSIEYRADLFECETMERFAGHFETLLRGVAAAPRESVTGFSLLTPADSKRILYDWNDTSVPFPTGLSLVDMLEAQAARTPAATAVVDEHESVPYSELHGRADLLAERLRFEGIGPGSLVGICLDRSVLLVVSILAVLKTGAAYVPLDPEYPAVRLTFMIDDAGAALVLTQEPHDSKFANRGTRCLLVNTSWRPGATDGSLPARRQAGADNPAYMIYTSGSTGRPKGVVIPNSAIVNHMQWMQASFSFGEADAVLQKTPIGFDASIWEFFAPLLAGARLVLAKRGAHRDPDALVAAIEESNITVLQVVPAVLQALLATPEFARCKSLRHVFCGGEALSPGLVCRFQSSLTATLHNLYGPAETTIDATIWTAPRNWAGSTVPIGRPISNVNTYVLGANRQLLPVGVPGELFVGGRQVGIGYHNRAELTASRFIPDSFSPMPGARMYATGDRARWLKDGTIEYLGRLDRQIKLRGQRLELGEIEGAVLRQPGVGAATAVVRQDASGDQRLVVYLIADRGEARPMSATLRDGLRSELPDGLIPSAFVVLREFPLTPNGKIDRDALPSPDSADPDDSTPHVGAVGALEQVIAEIWSEVLGVSRVSVEQDFFALGGHSLLATQVVIRITRLLRTRVTLRMFFEHPTVRGLSAALDAGPGPSGQVKRIAAAVLQLREMSATERAELRAGAAKP